VWKEKDEVIILKMGGILDVLGEVIGIYVNGEYGADMGDMIGDPDAYFGLELLDPENLLEFVATGDLPTFPQEVLDFVKDPSVSGFVGLPPGGVGYQSVLNVIDDIVDTPSWFAGGENAFDYENEEEEIVFGVEEETRPPVPPDDTVMAVDGDCCCCECS